MSAPIKTIHVRPGSELDRLLEDAADSLIELERGGVRYRLNRVAPPTELETSPNDEPVRASILNIVGIGASEERTNIARYKREYLAEAFDSTRRP